MNLVHYWVIKENECWESFLDVTTNLFGNKSSHYKLKVDRLMNSYKNNNILMSIKRHYLFEHLDKFPASCGGTKAQKKKLFFNPDACVFVSKMHFWEYTLRTLCYKFKIKIYFLFNIWNIFDDSSICFS